MPTEKSKVSKQKKADEKPKQTIATKDTLSTAGFAVAIASIFTNIFTLGVVAVVGLVLSIIGRVQTSRAGHPSGLALAGIIISATVMVFTFLFFILLILLLVFAVNRYQEECEIGMSAADSQECYSREIEKDLLPGREDENPLYRFERQPQL